MAKADKTEPQVQATDERPAEPTRQSYFNTGPGGRGWLYGLAAVVIIVLVFMAGVGVANHRQNGMVFKPGNIVRGAGGGGFGFGRRGFGGGGLGGSTNSSGQTRVNGVVTSVNGSDFTIAGNGTTTNVTTNSSTQYQTGDQVKQNDTVIVIGTQSNGTITASQIAINP